MQNSAASFADYMPKLNNPGSFAFNPVSHEKIELEILKFQLEKRMICILALCTF